MAWTASSRAAAAVLCLAAAAFARPPTAERPPAGHTGGFGEPTCVVCHLGSDLNAFGGRIAVEGLPAAYHPGEEYLLTVVLEAEGTEVAGFQMSARRAEGPARGRDAGTLRAADVRVGVSDSADVSYAHQSRKGSVTGSSDRASWTVIWTAPTDAGPVALHVAGNSGNGDNSPLSDLVYTFETLLQPAHRGADVERGASPWRALRRSR